MAKAFQKFIGQQETGAKKKERLRQEKKQARKETQEYFAKKKEERYQQRAAENQQAGGRGSFGKKDGRGKKAAGPNSGDREYNQRKAGEENFSSEGKHRGGKSSGKGFDGKRGGKSFAGKRGGKGFEGKRDAKSFEGNRGERKGGFVEKRGASSGFAGNRGSRNSQHSAGEGNSYFDRKKSSGKSGAGSHSDKQSGSGFRKGPSRIQTGQTGSDIGPTFNQRKPPATKQTTTYNRNTNAKGSNENAADGHSKSFRKSAGTDKQNNTGKTVTGKQGSTNTGGKQGKTNANAGTATDNNKASSASMPLNKFIAHSGICSRRDAAAMVKAGKVTVNGEPATDPGFKVTGKDQIKVNGKLIAVRRNLVYILLNKPKDFITTTDDPQGRKTVLDIIKHATTERVYPVGRLDRNTTGVLLLTNDGELAQKLSHPSYEIKKIYEVTLDKPLVKKDFDTLLNGITLEDGFIAPDVLAYADNKDKSVIGIEIHSGRNRIVRRIFEHLGYDVRNLDRVMYANLTKKNVERGKWRFLSEKEVRLLKYLNASFTKNKPARRG